MLSSLSPLSNHTISLAMVALDALGPLRDRLERAASLRFRAVQLNAADPDARPRDLSRSARRDLAAILRRHELGCTGVDLFVPPKDLVDPSRSAYAFDALAAAAEFAADMAQLTNGNAVLSARFGRETPADLLGALADRAQSAGCLIADHQHPPVDHDPASPIALGIDPATILASGPAADLDSAVTSAASSILMARLTDLDDGARCFPGDGRLDLLTYPVVLSTKSYTGPLILDLRGLPNLSRSLERASSEFAAPPVS